MVSNILAMTCMVIPVQNSRDLNDVIVKMLETINSHLTSISELEIPLVVVGKVEP